MACSTLLTSVRKRALAARAARVAPAIAAWVGLACSNSGLPPEPVVTASSPTPAPAPASSNHGLPPGGCPPAPGPGSPESAPGEDDQDVTRALLEGVLRASPSTQARDPAEVLAVTQPGPEHQYLRAFVGLWDAPSKFWPAPGAPPIVSPGSAMRKMILGGRFLYEDYEGHVFGKPYRGTSLTGYDQAKKAYTAVWVDSISTGIMATTGTGDSTGKVFTFNGAYRDPIAGRMRRTRATLRLINKDAYVIEMSFIEDDGKEFKTVEIDYKRRK